MYSGHGSGEKYFESSLKFNSFFNNNNNSNNSEEQKGQNFDQIEKIKPEMFLFGCQSLAFKAMPHRDYQPKNSVLVNLFTHDAQKVFGCSMNTVSNLIDKVQTTVVDSCLANNSDAAEESKREDIALSKAQTLANSADDARTKNFFYAACCQSYTLSQCK